MSRPFIRLVLPAAVMAVLAVGCGSGSGSGLSSSVSRPTETATIPDVTTRPPATDAPVEETEAPPAAPTEAPATEAPALPAPGPDTTPATTTDDGSSPWWPWLLAGLAVVAVVIGLIALMRRSPKATTSATANPSPVPTAPTAAVLAQSDEITTHLVGLAPSGFGPVAGADAYRLAMLITSVDQLMTSAPDDTSRRALAALYEPMRSLHSALDAIALMPQPASDAQAAEIRARATALHSATSLARATLLPPSPGPPM